MKSPLHHAPKCSTMKCVRVVGQGVPVRMPSEYAYTLVEKDHDGEYCTKKFWRDWHRKAGTEADAYVMPPQPGRARRAWCRDGLKPLAQPEPNK